MSNNRHYRVSELHNQQVSMPVARGWQITSANAGVDVAVAAAGVDVDAGAGVAEA